MKDVVLFGTGVFGRTVCRELAMASDYNVVAFTADREYCESNTYLDRPVVPFDEVASAYSPADYVMFIALGYLSLNRLKSRKYAEAKAAGYTLISHVSARAVTWGELTVGDNCFVGPNTVVDSSATIGNDVFIGSNCVVPHDTRIGDHCFLGDGVLLGGYVSISEYCFLGTGSIVRNRVRVARESVVGAGALILQDTAEKSVHMGAAAEELPISSDRLPPA